MRRSSFDAEIARNPRRDLSHSENADLRIARLQNAVLLSANNVQFKTDSDPFLCVSLKLKRRILSGHRRRRRESAPDETLPPRASGPRAAPARAAIAALGARRGCFLRRAPLYLGGFRLRDLMHQPKISSFFAPRRRGEAQGTLSGTVRRLWPYLWPGDRADLKARAGLAVRADGRLEAGDRRHALRAEMGDRRARARGQRRRRAGAGRALRRAGADRALRR